MMDRKTLFNQLSRIAIIASLLIVVGDVFCGGPPGPLYIVGDIPPSLKVIPVLEPVDLMQYVRDRRIAIILGKALFWDTQVGSDANMSCATCHYHAGIDNRILNTRHPGAGPTFEGPGPDELLKIGDFPTLIRQDPDDRDSPALRNFDDITGSQGVVMMDFMDVVPGVAFDLGLLMPDPIFNVNGVNVRQVTGRNTPTVINSIFNIRNFWDGRANNHFNANDPFGVQSFDDTIWVNSSGTIIQETVDLENCAGASQAVGPPNSDVEMAWNGRTFSDIGRKMLTLRPLAQQIVHTGDSVLGPYVHASGYGLNTTYEQLIQAAFRSRYWNPTLQTPDGLSLMESNFALFWGLAIQMYESTLISDDSPFDQFMEGGGPGGLNDHLLTPKQQLGLDLFRNIGQFPEFPVTGCVACHAHTTFSAATNVRIAEEQLEFPGAPILAEMPIEPMLMQDATMLATVSWATDPTLPQVTPGSMLLDFDPRGAFIEIIQLDFPGAPVVFSTIFSDGPETFGCPTAEVFNLIFPTGAGNPNGAAILLLAVASLMIDNDCNEEFAIFVQGLFPGNYDVRIDGQVRGTINAEFFAFYDFGFYNLGVRDQIEDIGQGGNTPTGEPLSFSRRVRDHFLVPEINVQINPDVPHTARIADIGAFKTPILRNVELTGPYFHNGGVATLEDVLKFYNRGGDFARENMANLSPAIVPLGLSNAEQEAIVAFLKSLTDDRVRFEMAPFDHPEIQLPNGDLIPAISALGRQAEGLPGLMSFAEKLENTAAPAAAGNNVQFENIDATPLPSKSSGGSKFVTDDRRSLPDTFATPEG